MGSTIHRRKDADPKVGVAMYGNTSYADPVNKKYPIDTPGRIKAAWAYVHQPSWSPPPSPASGQVARCVHLPPSI